MNHCETDGCWEEISWHSRYCADCIREKEQGDNSYIEDRLKALEADVKRLKRELGLK